MLIINNTAQYNNMPMYGNIVQAKNLIFGLRANAPTNTINLADTAVITANTVDYAEDGISCNSDKYLQTNLSTTASDLTIKTTIKLTNISTDKPVLLGIFGGYDGTDGIQLIMTSVPISNGYEYKLRFYSTAEDANGDKVLRSAQQTIQDINEQIDIYCRINDVADTISIKIGNEDWTNQKYTGTNYSKRKDKDWRIGASPNVNNTDATGVVVKELLVWNKVLNDTEMFEQNKLSKIWLNSLN